MCDDARNKKLKLYHLVLLVHFVVFVFCIHSSSHHYLHVCSCLVLSYLLICCSFIFILSLCRLGLLVNIHSFSHYHLHICNFLCIQQSMLNFIDLCSNFVCDIPNLVGKICLHCSICRWNQTSIQEQQHSYTSLRFYHLYLAIQLYLLVVFLHSPSHAHEFPNFLHMKFCFNESKLIS